MIMFGFLVLCLGCALVILAAIGEAKHPTAGFASGREVMRDGGILVTIGLTILLLGWLV